MEQTTAKDCEICGNKTSFERKDISKPREGDVCGVCDRWVCPDCIDWSQCLQPPLNLDVICKECENRA